MYVTIVIKNTINRVRVTLCEKSMIASIHTVAIRETIAKNTDESETRKDTSC